MYIAPKHIENMAKKISNHKLSILTNNSFAFIEKYMQNASPSGFEASGQALWLDYIAPYIDTYEIDNYGNTVGIINPKAKYRVVIAAHADEISWMVKYITDDGYIYVTANGGMDPQIALGKTVNIHTENGMVQGVFGWPAIHKREPGKDAHPKSKMLWIDVGAKNKKDIEKLGIEIGNTCTYNEHFAKLNNGYWISRAMDNKMGGVIIAEVAKMLHTNNIKLPFGLYIVNAVQEEVGLNGASMIVETIEPDMAIVLDVTHDTCTPNIEKKVEGEVYCGKGPALMISPAVHPVVLKLIKQTAKTNKIPYQLEACSPYSGTDTDAFAYGNCGVPSALISLPLRYMHTSVEMLHGSDVEACIELIYETLLKVDTDMMFTWK
jgi:putative aminopeptidase FrvX